MDVSKVLRGLEEVETKLSDLYGWFAEIFDDDPEAVSLFTQLRRDEESHRDLVAFQIRMVYRERKSFGEVDVDYKEIKNLIGRIEAIRNGEPPKLKSAVGFASQIENTAAESYYRSVLIQSNPAIEGLISTLAKENKRHQEMIEEFAGQRGMQDEEG